MRRLALFILLSLTSCYEVKKVYYPNGSLMAVIRKPKNQNEFHLKLSGKAYYYYPNGKLESTGKFKAFRNPIDSFITIRTTDFSEVVYYIFYKEKGYWSYFDSTGVLIKKKYFD